MNGCAGKAERRTIDLSQTNNISPQPPQKWLSLVSSQLPWYIVRRRPIISMPILDIAVMGPEMPTQEKLDDWLLCSLLTSFVWAAEPEQLTRLPGEFTNAVIKTKTQAFLLDINWTGLTNMLDIPGLNGVSDTIILDIISNYLVLPNRITVPLVSDLQIAQLRFPIPKGVLRIHFIEAHDLMWKDTYMKGLVKGKSDPYGVIRIGNQVFQSKVIKENLNPKWNEVYEALIYEHPGQELEIELFDEDTDKDDFLGNLLIDLAEVEKERVVDEWFTLDEATSGKLHLKLEWLSPKSTTENLDKVLTSIKADKDQADDGLSAAVLILYLDSARNLPNNPLELNQDGMKKSAVDKAKKRRVDEHIYLANNGTFFFIGKKRPYVGNGEAQEHKKNSVDFTPGKSTYLWSTLPQMILPHDQEISPGRSSSGKKMGSTPNPFVVFSVGHTVQESKVGLSGHSVSRSRRLLPPVICRSPPCSGPSLKYKLSGAFSAPKKVQINSAYTRVYTVKYKTIEPVWEQTFTFYVHNPKRQDLDIEVKDEYHQSSMGNLKIPLSQLLTSEDLTINRRFQLNNSGPNSVINMKIALRILYVDRPVRSPDEQYTSQVKRPSIFKGKSNPPTPTTPSTVREAQKPPPTPKIDPNKKIENGEKESPQNASPQRPMELHKSSSNLSGSSFTYSPSHLSMKEPTPSIASDISLPIATQELRQRLRQLQNGTSLGQSPLGQIQLTIRYSAQRHKLMVVVHSCRNLIAFSVEGSDPYVRMYLLPDKRRSGRRKTHVHKKTLNPVFDQTFEFNVSQPDLPRRTLDVAVKNSGGFLSKDKGLLGKLLLELNSEEITKGWTQCSIKSCFRLLFALYTAAPLPMNFKENLTPDS
ncbi:unnamed protein product [Ranitomeya imitator]|uniref:C2 domain-containing protein n=1 Tax=Ranitomeya imitator TaxID=111125 RepID=A0ABN9LTV1_9NEOB|nr:unnamed protein product [Ranitomeya imitator]